MNPSEFNPNLTARYVYGIQSGQFIKVGVALDMAKRLHTIRLSNPHPLKVIMKRRMRAAYHCERKIHEILKAKAIGREWFDATVEEVRAAAVIGAAYAREVHLMEVLRSIPAKAPATQATFDNAEGAYKTGTF